MLFASAIRDERAFEPVDKFDLHRCPDLHLGFGSAIHMCIVMHLAQLEMIALLKANRHTEHFGAKLDVDGEAFELVALLSGVTVDEEKAANDLIAVCCSRSNAKRLVLNL